MDSPWVSDVLLADGGTVHVRPIQPGDRRLLESFHKRQSPQSIYYRYFSPRPTLTDADLERLTRVDYTDRMAFVALLGSELVGVARYDRYPATQIAEIAFFTDEQQRGRGLATVLLEFLAAAAREAGLSGFVAEVLPENRRMLSVFANAGFDVSSHFVEGVIEVELGIEPTPEARAVIEERARAAFSNSMRRLLAPSSVAVVGVSRDASAIGSRVVTNLIEGGFTGSVVPVSTTATSIAGIPAVDSVLEIPDAIDIAVLCVPPGELRRVVLECGRRHVHGLIVITAGESSQFGATPAREADIVAMARRRGMRVLGPGSMGVINTSAEISMHATFVDVHPRRGAIGVLSQSGTLGAAIIEHAARRGLGISTFVALGERLDVSNNDALSYWENDPDTELVLCYLERFGNPVNFARITRRLAQSKPIVAVKSAEAFEINSLGAEVPVRARVDALLAQNGIIRVDTLPELFDVATILSRQPLPKGARLAIVSNARGPALLAADAALGAGLELAPLGSSGRQNPLDLGFEVDAAGFAEALEGVASDDGVDAVLVLCAPPDPGTIEDFATRIATAVAPLEIPVLATYLGLDPAKSVEGVPVFDFPEAAVRALGRIVRYVAWKELEQGTMPDRSIIGAERVVELRELVDGATEGWLDHRSAAEMARVALPTLVERRVVADEEAAVAAAEELGWPVALKAGGLDRPAKTEAGGVAVDLYDVTDLRRTYARMAADLGPLMDVGIVQAMAPPGIDIRVGIVRNRVVGAVLTLEVDRAHVERAVGAALQVVPCSDVDAAAMVERSGLVDALERAGGAPRRWTVAQRQAAHDAVVELLEYLSVFAEEVPEVEVLQLDPVILSPTGAYVTDVRIHIGAGVLGDPLGVRRLVGEE